MKRLKDFITHLFIPKEENNFKGRALHLDFLTYYLVFALVISIAFKRMGTNFSNVLGFATDITVDKLYQLTNEQRQKNGLTALQYNAKLAEAAQKKAQDMFIKNYWAHYGPDGSTPWQFILSSGYQYEFAGENLAKNFLFSQGVIDGWMNSQTHRDNILKSEYSDVGFAIVNGVLNGEETTLVIQEFGKPLSAPVAINKNNLLPIPQAKAEEIKTQPVKTEIPAVISQSKTQPKINLTKVSWDINVVFLAFLLFALTLDFYFAAKFNIVRIGGKSLAHFIFIMFIFLGLLFFFTKGAII